MISTDDSENNKELREMGDKLGIYKEMLYCYEGRYYYGYLCQSVKTKILKLNFEGEIILFPRRKVMDFVRKGKIPKIKYDYRGKVKGQLL